MRERTLLLIFLLVTSTALAKWERVSERLITAVDMINPRLGLAAALDGAPLLMRLDNGREFGITNTSGRIEAIMIRDKEVAFMAVTNDGIFRLSGNWEFPTRILADPIAKLVGITTDRVFATSGKKLLYSAGAAFSVANGIDTAQEIKSVAGIGTRIIAASQSSLYFSSNGGADWVKKSSLTKGGTVYLDTASGTAIAGGSPMLISRDTGKTWTILSTPIFLSTNGQVYGARDCSGTFYIVTEVPNAYDLFRSTDRGVTLQAVGQGSTYQLGLKNMVVIDRGSSVFWLDKEYNLLVSRNGIDGAITDSLAARLSIKPDTGIVASACPGSKAVPFNVRVGFTECIGIRIDNLTIEGNGFATTFTPKTLYVDEISVPGTYKASKVGVDSARIKVIFRSLITNQTETKTATIFARGVSGPAELALNTDNLSFGILDTSEQSIKSVSVLNMGCDPFRIDSVVSSLPEIFSVTGYIFPMYVLGGSRAYFNVLFSPAEKRPYLESLEIYTSEGIRYVTLSGEGTFDPGSSSVVLGSTASVSIKLAEHVLRTNDPLKIVSNEDHTQRVSIYTISGYRIEHFVLEPSATKSIALLGYANGKYFVVADGKPAIPFYLLR